MSTINSSENDRLEIISKGLTSEFTEQFVVKLLTECVNQKGYNTAIYIAVFFLDYFPRSFVIREVLSYCYYSTREFLKAHKLYHDIIEDFPLLSETKICALEHNSRMCAKHIKDHYINYPKEIIESLKNRTKRKFPLITFTITTCKRFDLFEKTINSFLNCCKDVHCIDHWLCVDDNSSIEDRVKMKVKYPFFEFYYKSFGEKGHPRSMNIIRDRVNTPYLFHMEDDWQYFVEKNYMTDCMEIISFNNNISQVLINRNYAETLDDFQIKGGKLSRVVSGKRFYVHEYCPTKETMDNFKSKYGQYSKQCAYWPHYSFRPSLVRTKVWKEVGVFDEKVNHFEMNYSYRVIGKKYVSVFLEGIYSLHIGRLTSERNSDKKNAYVLNNESQFSGKKETIPPRTGLAMKSYVVNLDRRPDRWKEFDDKAKVAAKFLRYSRFSAVDGNKLEPTVQLQQIFDGNDYNMRSGMVGCAMSHIQLYIELVNSELDLFCILEDDIEFTDNFQDKFCKLLGELSKVEWDLAYMGHHAYIVTDTITDKNKQPSIYKSNAQDSLKFSMGGTGGYLITKNGAKKFLEFINSRGMTNGIDTVQQKSADILNVYYCTPHLIFSECFRGNNRPDTDIQFNFLSLTIPVTERLEIELDYYKKLGQELSEIDCLDKVEGSPVYYRVKKNEFFEIKEKMEKLKFPHYFLGKEFIVVVPNPTKEIMSHRFFDRLKCDGKFDISKSIVYKK